VNVKEVVEFKLRPALRECEQHRARLHSAWLEAVSYPELAEGSTGEFTERQVRTLDQLLFRFGKLQDAIGMRLLPALLRLVQEWRDDEPFLDKLNRAEKLGMLPSAEQWQWLREMRNQTAHEYPDQPEISAPGCPCSHAGSRAWTVGERSRAAHSQGGVEGAGPRALFAVSCLYEGVRSLQFVQ
jgi:hypothetical protein